MNRLLKQYWPFLFILSIWFIFSHPYFLKGKVPFPSTYQVNHFPPWNYYSKYWGPVRNGAMPDIIDQIYPWRHLTLEIWKKGQIPLWNPYNFSGNPHLANFQSAVLSPFNLLFLFLPFVDAWSILVLLQPLLAGLFAYILMREFKVSKLGSLISSITFMFCGFIVVWMAYGTLSLAISLLPLALFSIEKFYSTKQNRYLILLSLTFPLSFFSGHFQTSLYFALFVVAYIVYKLFSIRNILITKYIMLYTLFGILLTLPQILPSIELYLYSVRSQIFITGRGIPWYYLVTVFSPDFFGNPVTRNDWIGSYAEWASFIGIIPLTLTIIAVFKKKTSLVLFFFSAGIIALLLSLNSPLQPYLEIFKLPVLSTSNPTRIIVIFSFSFAVLSGFGFDVLKTLASQRKLKEILIVLGGIGLILGSIWITLFLIKILSHDKMLIAQRNLILPTVLFAAFSGLIIINFIIKNKKFIILTLYFVLLLVSFDSIRFAQKWMPFDPKHLAFSRVEVLDAIQKNQGSGRYFGNLGAQVASFYGVQSLDGYDPLYIKRYGEFIRASGNGEFLEAERSVVKAPRLGMYTDRVLDLLGVGLIFHPIADTNQGWAYHVWNKKDRLVRIYRDDKFELYKNTKALPRAFFFYDYGVISDDKKILRRFYSDEFDFRKKLILEKPIGKLSNGKGSVNIISYTPNEVIINAATSTQALLFLSDNYFPGWKAYIDGKLTEIYRADYSFRAVVVPEGNHRVKFRYVSRSFQAGLVGSAIGIIGILGAGMIKRKKRQV